MTDDAIPSLNLAISSLATSNNFARWVTKAPLPGGYVHHDCEWTESLATEWMAWQEMFCLEKMPTLPMLEQLEGNSRPKLTLSGEGSSYGGRLMQKLGISLWQWLFQASIGQSFAQSQGIALGKNQPLRIRLECRNPYLILLPWEIMQQAGKQAISLHPNILFSRTTSDVEPLPPIKMSNSLNILLVIGEKQIKTAASSLNLTAINTGGETNPDQALESEATNLIRAISPSGSLQNWGVKVKVDTLIRPGAEELTKALDKGKYKAFFYAGHGIAAPNGGSLFLRPGEQLNGTELAQALVRNQVILAVFNACWGAYPAKSGQAMIPRSSLAEVLIHHGVPAVLAMRDAIASREALSFIEVFTRSLLSPGLRVPIDQAVRIARQQLLTLYKYNQPAWTLPILYMHPEFDGQLLQTLDETQSPTVMPNVSGIMPAAFLYYLDRPERKWSIRGGAMNIGRDMENDLHIAEKWISKNHCRIICRKNADYPDYQYFLEDFSRFGTFIYQDGYWKQVHNQEVPLESGLQIRFGSHQGQILEFVVE
ncbi:MAG: CHAT domain-containing protein [Microcystis panniformis WG22]|nr:CHAT domain-containing protein [Microcystis panniformis WG22]